MVETKTEQLRDKMLFIKLSCFFQHTFSFHTFSFHFITVSIEEEIIELNEAATAICHVTLNAIKTTFIFFES